MHKNHEIIIYTDGACSGNPGPGGWGAVIYSKENKTEISGYELDTTNNRMEILAAIKALESLETKSTVLLYTDSNYLKLGITSWIKVWKKNNWKNRSKKLIKNLDLWKRLDELNSVHLVNWSWVKAHSGNSDNERADNLATGAIKDLLR